MVLDAFCYYALILNKRGVSSRFVWSNVFSVYCFVGILVFLTGKREISYMCRKVGKALNGKKRTALSLSSGASTEGIASHTDGAAGVDGLSKKRSREVVDDVSSTESSADHADNTLSSGDSSSMGALRGLDDDEIDGEDGEGGAVDGQDDDLYSEGADDSDGEDYESEEDGDGYDSLGEEVIFAEEKANRSASASVLLPTFMGKEGAEEGGHKDEDAVRLRNKMLKEVLGLPEVYVTRMYSSAQRACLHILSRLYHFIRIAC